MGGSERSPSVGKRVHTASPAAYRAALPVYRAAVRVRSAIEIVAFRMSPDSRGRRGPVTEAPRIVLDGCAFGPSHGGIARLWNAIMAEWSTCGFAEHVVVLDRAGTAPRHPGFTYRRVPPLRAHDSRLQQTMLGELCRGESADVFVSTMYTTATGCPSVLYLYDMTPEVQGWDLSEPQWREKCQAIEDAAAYVCLSQSTADDLLRLYPVALQRPVTVALPGIEARFEPAPLEAVAAFRRRLNLPERYYLFIGHRDDYKNARLLFSAVTRMQDDPEFGVLLLGGSPVLEADLSELAGRVPVRLAQLTDADLLAAYSGARALIYVSKYEGFGLPIVEAMACDCPVITCRNSSLPEAAGDAALYVGEDDPAALVEAMRRVLEAEVRADLIARGRAHSALFEWGTCAELVRETIVAAARDTTEAETQ